MDDLESRRRLILERVAAGELAPDTAFELLEALGPPTEQVAEPIPGREEPVTSIRVVGTFRTLRIEGDSSVRTAVAEGAHKVRMEEGAMIFEDRFDEEDEGYMLFGPERGRKGVHVSADFGRGRRFRWQNRPPVLRIRMNPNLPLEVDMTAGTARVRGVHGPIRAGLSAGSARFEDVRSPFRAAVDAGSVSVRGRFDKGDSEVRCTAGKVRLELEKGSSVRIEARATLGKISLPNGAEWQGLGSGKREAVVGAGEGRLEIEATTGTVVVHAE